MYEYTQTLVPEINLIMCNAIVFQNNAAGQMEEENEFPCSYTQKDLFYIIYTNLGINAYECTRILFGSFPYFNSICEFIFHFAESRITTINCQAKCKVSLDVCFVSLSECQCVC